MPPELRHVTQPHLLDAYSNFCLCQISLDVYIFKVPRRRRRRVPQKNHETHKQQTWLWQAAGCSNTETNFVLSNLVAMKSWEMAF